MNYFAQFDQNYGDCVSIVSSRGSALEGCIIKEVEKGAKPDELWYNFDTGEIQKRIPYPIVINDSYQIGDTIEIPKLDNTLVTINGYPVKGVYHVDTTESVILMVRGPYYLTKQINFVDYRGQRKKAYPSIEDQLDLIFHEGIDVWKTKIQEIKEEYPKI